MSPADAALARGKALGRYLVLDEIGHGGMGVVYAAYDPELDRRVAIKLLRPDGDRDAAETRRARLQREAQAMARLDHPNVITVYDVGTTGEQVFLAMEFVDGGTLKHWLAERARPWREVLAVFVAAARGLAAAHEAGLVHRDFKPDNVLVRKDGAVRVTDFGLARAARDEEPVVGPSVPSSSALDTKLTRTGAVMGTPAYMAPEQHRGRGADARADQFAFCVALHEGIYGEHPFRPRVSETTDTLVAGSPDAAPQDQLSPADALALAVVDGRIQPPARDRDAPAWLRRALLRGLSVEPNERWPSMDALIAALTRDAGASRRRNLVLAAAVAAAGLGVGVVASRPRPPDPCGAADAPLAGVWDAGRRRELEAAFAAIGRPYGTDVAARVTGLLDAYATRWTAARVDACQDTRVRAEQSEELLDLRMSCLDRRLSELRALSFALTRAPDAAAVDKAIPASLGLTNPDVCADLAAVTAAARGLPEDARLRARVVALEGRLDEAQAFMDTGASVNGRVLAHASLVEARLLGVGRASARALTLVGRAYRDAGDGSGTEATAHEAIRVAAAAHEDRHEADAWQLLVYAVGHLQGRLADTGPLLLPAEAANLRAADPVISARLDTIKGILFNREARYPEAEAALRHAVATLEPVGARGETGLAAALDNLGHTLLAQDRYPDALEVFERGRAIRERLFGPSHPHYATALVSLGTAYNVQDRYSEARPYLERGIAILEAARGPKDAEVAYSLEELAGLLFRQRDLEGAVELRERALAIWLETRGPDHHFTASTRSALGGTLVELGRYEEAVPHLERALSAREARLGKDHPAVAGTLTSLGNAHRGLRRCDLALPLLRRAVAIREHELGKTDPSLAAPLIGQGVCLLDTDPEAALTSLERALSLATTGGESTMRAAAGFGVARALRATGRDRARARTLAEEARAAFAGLGDQARQELGEIDAWLTTTAR
jgi:tetratricopeptide (TPR) repeat protein